MTIITLYSIKNYSDKVIKIFFVLLIGMSFLNCAGSNNENDTSDTPDTPDSLVFNLEINDEFYGIVKSKADEGVDCSATGISSITAYVYADDGSLLADGGPWECETHSGEITGSMAGENRTIIVQAMDENGIVLYQGSLSQLTINSGENALGTITLNYVGGTDLTEIFTETGTITESEEQVYYNISVDEGKKLFVNLNIAGSYQEFYLYVKYGSPPTLDDYDERSTSGADEAIEISLTQAGTYYIMVYANRFWDAYSGEYTITTSYDLNQLQSGVSYENSIKHGEEKIFYQTTVNEGDTLFVNLNISGSRQQFYLYVKYGGIPTLDDYDARSSTGADEAIEIATTQAGTYYILVYANRYWDSYSGDYTITASSGNNQLELGVSYEDTMAHEEEKVYYQTTVTGGGPLIVNLNIPASWQQFHLYVKYGGIPTLDDYDARSITGEDEAIEIATTQAGTYYIMVYANRYWDSYSGDYTITASSAANQLELGVSYEDTIAHEEEKVYYQTTVTGGGPLIVNLNIPASWQQFHLYVKHGGIPTLDDYDDRSITGEDEAIEIATTQAGTYYIMVYANRYWDSYSGDYTITASN